MTAKTKCSLFNCDHKHGNYCCANCDDYHKCKNHCMNDPEKCGLAVKKANKTILIKAEVSK